MAVTQVAGGERDYEEKREIDARLIGKNLRVKTNRIVVVLFLLIGVLGCSHPQNLLDAQDERRDGSSQEITLKARELTRDASDSDGKAQAIYDWIVQNISRQHTPLDLSEEQSAQAARLVFERRTANPAGYSNLFLAMARAAGVEAEAVPGGVKPWEFTIDEEIRLRDWQWSVFRKSDGSWGIVDCCRGAGFENDKGEFVIAPTQRWFDPPSGEFFLTSYPAELRWLTGYGWLTEERFKELPMVNYDFEKQGLGITPRAGYTRKVPKEYVLEYSNPHDTVLEGEMWSWDGEKGKFIKHATVEEGEGRALVRFTFPEPGRYELRILSRERDQGKFEYVCLQSVVSDERVKQADLPPPVPGKQGNPKLDKPGSLAPEVSKSTAPEVVETKVPASPSEPKTGSGKEKPSTGKVERPRSVSPAPAYPKARSTSGERANTARYSSFADMKVHILKGDVAQLGSGRSSTISLRVPGAPSVLIRNGSEPIFMKKNGDVFTATFTPTKGDADVLVGVGGNSYKVVLSYDVI